MWAGFPYPYSICRFFHLNYFCLHVFPFKVSLCTGLPFQTIPMCTGLPFQSVPMCTGPPFQTITLCRSSFSNYFYLQFFPFKLDLSACLPFQTLYLQFFHFKLDLSACLPFQTLYLQFFPLKLDLSACLPFQTIPICRSSFSN